MTRARDIASGADFSTGIDAGEVIPHIIPGVLYPAVADKMLDGTTSLSASTTGPNSSTVASSKYGTVQSDGRMYYYTSIKGSKPIKDPRIGGHFGSQRHKTKSLQLLEQETATHGKNVYSVDGREWIRGSGDGELTMNVGTDSSNGMLVLTANKNSYIEIVGYFNDMNVMSYTATNRDWRYTLDGATENTTDYGSASVGSPLTLRYVDSGALINLGLGATLGIHTIKITSKETVENVYLFCIELIAKDTSSTANKSKIQIPSQNVVSYGKKFTVSGTPHYDPFNGFTSGNLAAVQALIDTDSSLGMANWLSSSTYYRPFNGGRVVKWVDSSGNIKTSVTMMPPNAQNVGGTASNAHTLGNANDQTINFDTTTLANATPLSEVAKTFNWREFGNGSANGGTSSGTYADASMLKDGVDDDVAYVMDDGLTSFSAETIEADSDQLSYRFNANDAFYVTFIGTGISIEKKTSDTQAGSDSYTYNLDGVALTTYSSSNATHPKFINLAQNLPYGTHILKVNRSGHSNVLPFWKEFTYHQPKMPPIPEDAVVLADYMLMADFVKTGVGGYDAMSKGVRKISLTRDVFVDSSSALGANVEINTYFSYFFRAFTSGSAKVTTKLPAFASEVTWQGEMGTASIDSSEKSWGGNAITMAQASGGTASTEVITYSSGTKPELGMNDFQHLTQSGGYRTNAMEIATPIHTSSHYQTFETPFLKELTGGDRNMEQTNLIVTPDGKTWDEVTRDTSYIGPEMHNPNSDTGRTDHSPHIFDEHRGTSEGIYSYHSKNFAVAYDRQICLVDGMYHINTFTHRNGATDHSCRIYVNNVQIAWGHHGSSDHDSATIFATLQLKRGDYVEIRGYRMANTEGSKLEITRLK